jgi:hypothetical protein
LSETGGFRDFGGKQAKELWSGEAAVRPAAMVEFPATSPAATPLSQHGPQTHPQPMVELSQLERTGFRKSSTWVARVRCFDLKQEEKIDTSATGNQAQPAADRLRSRSLGEIIISHS